MAQNSRQLCPVARDAPHGLAGALLAPAAGGRLHRAFGHVKEGPAHARMVAAHASAAAAAAPEVGSVAEKGFFQRHPATCCHRFLSWLQPPGTLLRRLVWVGAGRFALPPIQLPAPSLARGRAEEGSAHASGGVGWATVIKHAWICSQAALFGVAAALAYAAYTVFSQPPVPLQLVSGKESWAHDWPTSGCLLISLPLPKTGSRWCQAAVPGHRPDCHEADNTAGALSLNSPTS